MQHLNCALKNLRSDQGNMRLTKIRVIHQRQVYLMYGSRYHGHPSQTILKNPYRLRQLVAFAQTIHKRIKRNL